MREYHLKFRDYTLWIYLKQKVKINYALVMNRTKSLFIEFKMQCIQKVHLNFRYQFKIFIDVSMNVRMKVKMKSISASKEVFLWFMFRSGKWSCTKRYSVICKMLTNCALFLNEIWKRHLFVPLKSLSKNVFVLKKKVLYLNNLQTIN